MLHRYSPIMTILGAAATVTGLGGLWADDGTVPLPTVFFAAAVLVAVAFSADTTAGPLDTMSFAGCLTWIIGGLAPLLPGGRTRIDTTGW